MPRGGTHSLDGYCLLYVGITPVRALKPETRKPRTLRDRLRDHCCGPIATSTLRRRLACLLQDRLGFEISRSQAGKLVMRDADERVLSE